MPPLGVRSLALLFAAACAAPGGGPVVSAPSVEVPAAAPRASPPPHAERLTACALPWTLQDVEGDHARVVVVCGNDVRRAELEPGPVTRAIEPILEPARARVCACAARLPVPAFVDLVVTTTPDDGRTSAEADEPDDELDREVATAFVACVGKVQTAITRAHAEACGTEKAIFKYPLRVDLTH